MKLFTATIFTVTLSALCAGSVFANGLEQHFPVTKKPLSEGAYSPRLVNHIGQADTGPGAATYTL